MRHPFLLAAVLLWCALPARAAVHHFRSPDGRYLAAVIFQHTSSGDDGEGVVTVSPGRGRRAVRRSFVSRDAEHGEVIECARWTPDSSFFVFTTLSSGGHSAWHHWTFVWDRRDNRIHSLDDAYQCTVTASFQVKKPDVLSTRMLDIHTSGDATDPGVPITVRLSRVRWKPGVGENR